MNMGDTQQLKAYVRQVLTEALSQKVLSNPATQHCPGVFQTVDAAIQAAEIAQRQFEECNLDTRRRVVEAIKKGMVPFVDKIAEDTLRETGMGRVEHKKLKLKLVLEKTPGVEDLITEVQTGDHGMVLYELSPYGVVGAITPSTNPGETLICNAIGMLSAGNSVYFSVHPGAKELSRWIVGKLNEIVYEEIGINNLIVTIEKPSIEAAQEMMKHPDISLLAVTGGPEVVYQCLSSGKKAIGAGAGNPPAIVDETANVEKAAFDIVHGASFDNNILCIAEKSVVAVRDISDFLIFNMEKAGAFLVKDSVQIEKLRTMTLMENGNPSRKFIGKDAKFILESAGISCSYDPSIIILKAEKCHDFVMKEMLMPILPIVEVDDFEEALKVAIEIEQGLHHTATMHSTNIIRLNKAARMLQTSIFVKNGSSYAGLGFGGEGTATFTIATPTGEGTTTSRHFARRRRCVLTDGFSIR